MSREQYRKTFLWLFEDALVEEFFAPGEPILTGAIDEAAALSLETGATMADLAERTLAARIRVARKLDRMRGNRRVWQASRPRTSRRRQW